MVSCFRSHRTTSFGLDNFIVYFKSIKNIIAICCRGYTIFVNSVIIAQFSIFSVFSTFLDIMFGPCDKFWITSSLLTTPVKSWVKSMSLIKSSEF